MAEKSDVVLAMLADPAAASEVAKSIARGIGKGCAQTSAIQLLSVQRVHNLKGIYFCRKRICGRIDHR